MTTINIEATVNLNLSEIKDALRDHDVLVFEDADAMADHLRDVEDYQVFSPYANINDLLEGHEGADAIDWLRSELADEDILEYLDEETIGIFAVDRDLVQPDLMDISPRELWAAMQKHWDHQAEKLAQYKDLQKQHARQRDDAMRERDEAVEARSKAVAMHPTYQQMKAELSEMANHLDKDTLERITAARVPEEGQTYRTAGGSVVVYVGPGEAPNTVIVRNFADQTDREIPLVDLRLKVEV